MKILNVFTNEKGEFGNPVGIMVDTEQKINKEQRQQIAKESGLSEVVFINDNQTNNISIYSPQREIPFAGHAAVGTAYFLRETYGQKIDTLISMGKSIPTWQEGNLTWVRGDLTILPPWNYEEMESAKQVEELKIGEMAKKEHTVVWAWIDQKVGTIRARTFAADWGIPEDEANGSGAMKLAVQLNREIIVVHGKGSIIHARPSGSASAEVGGLVAVA